ncbi:MAG TPA: hypothetical protein VMF08_15970 [Candidatus Sulfotelmatobacter sp.]|nr:hypothetical protein [Candidatus Sulfotelmatobacter sp.]
MRIFKLACIFLGIFSLYSALVGFFGHVSSANQILEEKYAGLIRCYSLANALIFGMTFYYVNKRKSLGWKLGWAFWCILFVDYMILALAKAQRMPQSEYWFAIKGSVPSIVVFVN